MPLSTVPEWQQLALYAGGAALLLVFLFKLPYVGRVLRTLFSVALLGLALFLLLQQAPFDPTLARLAARLGLDRQSVVGDEVRIAMSPDGHFWARVTINGVPQRMLVDSGATVTAISAQTAQRTGVEAGQTIVPVIMHTANGAVPAQTGAIAELRLGGIVARELKVVISPTLGPIDVIGMNFLSQLASWRVEQRTLILVPAVARGEKGD